jgi:hypothetical protein
MTAALPPSAPPLLPRHAIVLLLDSLNRHLPGACGGRQFATPNLDRLARRAPGKSKAKRCSKTCAACAAGRVRPIAARVRDNGRVKDNGSDRSSALRAVQVGMPECSTTSLPVDFLLTSVLDHPNRA